MADEHILLMVGSSIVRRWKPLPVKAQSVVNVGKEGLQTSAFRIPAYWIDLHNHIQDRPVGHILVYAGVNDLRHGVSPDVIFRNLVHFYMDLHREFPSAHLVCMGLLLGPGLSRYMGLYPHVVHINQRLRRFCARRRYISFINSNVGLNDSYFLYDGFHLTRLGYDHLNFLLHR